MKGSRFSKITLLAATMLCATIWISGLALGEITKSDLESETQKINYALGFTSGKNIKQLDVDINTELLVKGFRDGVANDKDALMDEEELNQLVVSIRAKHLLEQQKEMKLKAEANKVISEKFLAENKKKKGVVTLPSGLQYKVLKEGKGQSPKVTDKVVCHYKGTLIDGTEFDSSYKRNTPSTFAVNRVIKGWTEALQLMKTGAKWQLFLHSDLAYGSRGAGQKIDPGATLIFEVELIRIES